MAAYGHAYGVRVQKVLRVLRFDAPLARGLWIALRAMLMKSELRDSLHALIVILNEVKNRRSKPLMRQSVVNTSRREGYSMLFFGFIRCE